jgi:hypothetical protein
MSALPDDAIPVMRSLTAPAHSKGAVTLSWTATDNVLVAGYQLHARLGSGAWTPLVETTATSQVLTLPEGAWTIAVRAIDDAGNLSAWRTASVRVDTTAPVMTKLAADSTIVRTIDGKIAVRWSASDAVGVTGYQLRTRRTSTGVWSSPIGTTATSRVFTLAPDTWYVGVRARDAAGNLGEWREVRVVVLVDDRSFHFSAGTTRRTSSIDYRGTTTTTSRSGASLTTTFTGTGVYVVGRAGPLFGRFRVTVDGHATIVDSGFIGGRRATTTHTRVILFSATISNLGTAGRPTMALDGIGYLR